MKTKWTVKLNSLKTLALLAAGGLATQLVSGQCVTPPNALIAWWPGDSSANDVIGTNNGVLISGATYAIGIVGEAFSLDGVDDYVEVTTSDLFNFNNGQGDFTIEAWIKPAVLQHCGLIGKATQQPYGWVLGVNAAGRLFFSGVGIWALSSSPGTVEVDQWQHVAVTKLGGAYRLFKNGVEVGYVSHSGSLETSTAPLRIGTTYAEAERFNGLIDEPAILNRALSVSEIAAIYAAGGAGMCKALHITEQPKSQLGYWGKSVSFSVTATNGVPPYGYQWQKDGLALPDATNSLLVLADLQATNAGIYTVVVADSFTNLTSQPATLTVNPAGMSIALYVGVAIDGVVGQPYGVQSTLDLSHTNSWMGRANVTLTNATQLWYDSQPATQPQTYYRVVPGPISIP